MLIQHNFLRFKFVDIRFCCTDEEIGKISGLEELEVGKSYGIIFAYQRSGENKILVGGRANKTNTKKKNSF